MLVPLSLHGDLLACLCVLLPGSLGGQGQSPRLYDVNGDKDVIHSPSVFKTFYSVSVTFEDSLCAQVWLQKHDWEGGRSPPPCWRA